MCIRDRYNLARAALLAGSLTTGKLENLDVATGDCLHQPYRFGLIENGEDIVHEAKDLGALGAFISGAGPSIVAMVYKGDRDYLSRAQAVCCLLYTSPVRGQIIRPLLDVERVQIEAYLAETGQDYVTDSSNADKIYTRNRLRHTVVPALRAIQPAAAQSARRLGELLRQDEDCLDSLAQECLTQAERTDGAWDIAPLQQAHPAVRTRALRSWLAQQGMPLRDLTQRHIQALDALLENENPSACCDLPHGFAVRREYGAIRLLSGVETSVELPEIPLSVPFEGMVWDGRCLLYTSCRYLSGYQGIFDAHRCAYL